MAGRCLPSMAPARWRSPMRSACRWSAGARSSVGRMPGRLRSMCFTRVISRVGVLPLFTFVLFYRAQVALNGFLADHGWVPPTLERLAAVSAWSAGADVRALCDHSRLRRLLAASAVALVRLVVGAAFAAPRAAPDDVLVGRPQSRAGRSDQRAVVRRHRAGDRRPAAAVPVAGAGAAVPRKPVARQCAGVVRRGWASGC